LLVSAKGRTDLLVSAELLPFKRIVEIIQQWDEFGRENKPPDLVVLSFKHNEHPVEGRLD
jgi:hypothetical protein